MENLNSLTWRKASRSTSNGGACVELAAVPHTILVRDSKDPDGPRLDFTIGEFRRFAAFLKDA